MTSGRCQTILRRARRMRPGIRHLLLCVLALLFASGAQAQDCNPRTVYTDSSAPAEVNPERLYHEYPSGARWELCVSFDTHSGLVVSDVTYGAPAEPLRKVLDEMSLGQILLKYDEDTQPSHVLSNHRFGAEDLLESGPGFCDDGEWVSAPGTAGNYNLCKRERDINNLTQVRREVPLRRRELSLHAWARGNNFIYQTIWRFSEDGEITPELHMQGRLARFTDDPRYGTAVAGIDKLASNATLLANWRLDFNIDGSEHPDVAEEFEFPALVFEVVSLPLNIRPVQNEAFLRANAETFRGWRIRDSVASAVPNGKTRVGYYLDPQTSGYSYRSRASIWPSYDVTLTRDNPCERTASHNAGQSAGCSEGLDQFNNSESIVGEDVVLWFSVARHLVPRSEDYPAIGSIVADFKLIPFDWSAYTPFTPPGDDP